MGSCRCHKADLESNGDARSNEIKLSKCLSQGRLHVASLTMIDVRYVCLGVE